jgi:hypothetical protein
MLPALQGDFTENTAETICFTISSIDYQSIFNLLGNN